MDKKEEFKQFAVSHPELIKVVNEGKETWQSLYEIYDIYGDNKEAWKKYETNSEKSIKDMIKNIDMDSIQEHIKTAQKALGFISELATTKTTETITSTPRPITKFFGD